MRVAMHEIEFRTLLLQLMEATLHGERKCELLWHVGEAPQEREVRRSDSVLAQGRFDIIRKRVGEQGNARVSPQFLRLAERNGRHTSSFAQLAANYRHVQSAQPLSRFLERRSHALRLLG